MTFEEALVKFPGMYTEADRAQYNAAQAQQQQQNAQQNAQANTFGGLTPDQQANAMQALQTTATLSPQQQGMFNTTGGLTGIPKVPGLVQSTGFSGLTSQPQPSSGQLQSGAVQSPTVGATTNAGFSGLSDSAQPRQTSVMTSSGQQGTSQDALDASDTAAKGYNYGSSAGNYANAGVGGQPQTAGTATPTYGVVTNPQPLNPPGGGATTNTSTSAGPRAGGAAYNQLMDLYRQNGGGPLDTPEQQQAFNQWASQVTTQFGVTNWEDLPADFSTRFNPSGGQPFPVGYQPYTPATTNGTGGNYNQNQNAAQTGNFQTTGNTQANQTQTSTGVQGTTQHTTTGGTNQQQTTGTQTGQQTGSTTTTGTQQQTGGQQQQTTGQESSTGTATTRPIDTLGFGELLKNQAGAVGQSDAERGAFLKDVIQTGGTGFNSQVDQAVRNSLTGPQLAGAGDSARARAAGYAGAQVARNNMGERLSAAQQLAGPTGLATLSTAANPYVGQQATTTGNTSTTGSSTGTNFSNLTSNQNVQSLINSINNNTSNTSGSNTGFSDLTGQTASENTTNTASNVNENQSGTATGKSSQAASGQIPQAQQVSTGGGGCVLCTAATHLGLFHNLRVLRTVIDFKLRRNRSVYHSAARGYFFLFTPLAEWLLKRPRVAKALYPLARAVVYEELRLSGRPIPRRKWAKFVHDVGHWTCHLIGKLPVSAYVQNPVIEKIARENKIWFQMEDSK